MKPKRYVAIAGIVLVISSILSVVGNFYISFPRHTISFEAQEQSSKDENSSSFACSLLPVPLKEARFSAENFANSVDKRDYHYGFLVFRLLFVMMLCGQSVVFKRNCNEISYIRRYNLLI
ncbi:MAG: hypothetical protein II998_02465 [Clostridia bacterium]|nr:hypothetical protein [Clostridia bacterium]